MSRMLCLLRLLVVCLCLLFLGHGTAVADLPHWDAAAQGKFVTSLTADAAGRVWAGTEENGVWAASGTDPDKGWTHYGVKDGLGQGDVSALVCDTKGRIWAGHRSAGVSVFNGQTWKNYDAAHGPLGSHVFALAVSPKDGDVWIGTDAGLTRYSAVKDTWKYYTRAEHLPSDQISALAFDAKGTLYVGTQCDGLAIGTPADDYASWQHLIGPTRPGLSPSGPGFPDCRITALLATRDGSVYAGTPTGLTGSQDGGKSWTYLRGKDWYKKVEGRTGTVPTDLAPAPTPTLAEDYVSALAEDSAGRLWIGHSAKGVEVADTAQPGHAPVGIFAQPLTDDVHCRPAGADRRVRLRAGVSALDRPQRSRLAGCRRSRSGSFAVSCRRAHSRRAEGASCLRSRRRAGACSRHRCLFRRRLADSRGLGGALRTSVRRFVRDYQSGFAAGGSGTRLRIF